MLKCSIIYKIQHYFISVFVFLFLYTKYPKYTDISLNALEGLYSIRKGSLSSLFLQHKTKQKHKEKDLKQDKIASNILWLY